MASPGPATAGELLRIDPLELRFPFELKKQISCSMQLSNLSDDYIAFKVKTTSPKKYSVRPNTGVVLPRSTCDVVVTMQAQREAPPDMQCKDKFLVQSVVAPSGVSVKDVTGEMFMKESGNKVEEVKLRVTYIAPPQPPSPVPEESEEGSPSRVSESENGDSLSGGFTRALRERIEPQDNSLEDMMRREISKKRGGFSFIIVIIVALIVYLVDPKLLSIPALLLIVELGRALIEEFYRINFLAI
uniref:MSP domain-containing protein n=1 Tax=Leersia perrieri TaxID=77586 RepID=A0A0D9X4K6_9ORYZ